jgi:hypothetical protein
VCDQLNEICSDISHGADLHQLGPDAMRHLVSVERLAAMDALYCRVCEILEKLSGA